MSKAAELAKMGEVLTNNQIGGRRNIVINGAMQVAQRGTSHTPTTSEVYTLDRFKIFPQGSTAGRATITQDSSAPNGFANSLKIDVTTADTSIAASEAYILGYQAEGQDVQMFKKGTSEAEQYTVSFYVKGNASATYVLELFDMDNSRQISKTFNVTTDWARVIMTFPSDTTGSFDDDNASSLALFFHLHAGSTYTSGTINSSSWAANNNANRVGSGTTSIFDSTDRTFFITGLQMEVGSVATPFEHRSFGEELMLCRRYYQENKCSWYGVYSASGYYESDGLNYVPVCRANPTTAQVSFDSGGSRASSSSITSGTAQGAIIYVSPSSSGGNEGWTAIWSADAEL